MDGHSSHVTANVIAFCMENAIDLLILPPHTSHILQPLDVGVFAPLKRALASETDAALRLDAGRMPRVHGWRSAGLMPLSPITVLGKLPGGTTLPASPPHTPHQHHGLDISLLNSPPPDGTELRQATSLLITTMQACAELPSPAKRFTERMTRAFEAASSENVTLRKQVKEQAELLLARKARKKGPNTLEALRLIDPALIDEVLRLCTRNPPPEEHLWMTVRFGGPTKRFKGANIVTKLNAPPTGNATVRRNDLLQLLANSIRPDHVSFNKKVVNLTKTV
ncbi:hypothetical protein KC360_g8943 [Hortaea werneckii]|nr:hypothetical protein KC325_g8928 [Hortaea werneckii]KAI6985658.1 hypothetical protein KC359_g9069 [Hortaea werneckii]KAI7140130.1 hypothetical protein KC344_g8930 [Hortaea werneckii]KAI7166937.1 hypothetical protein KC360_g8943 [Hortaea werneckii]KAI7502082.1 hypothetical protein KC347_g9056 [Hortaea werneckii]